MVSFGTSLTVSNCTFSNNVNDSTEEPFASAISQYAGTMLVVNSTFNQSLDAGAILSRGTSATIANSTFTGNNEDGGGGSAIYAAQGTVTSSNNIFANNSDKYDGHLDRETDDYFGPVVLNSYHDIYFGNSFVEGPWTSDCDDCTTQVGPVDTTSNPVGTLAFNGGTVQTELPLPGAGVICAGLTSQLPGGTPGGTLSERRHVVGNLLRHYPWGGVYSRNHSSSHVRNFCDSLRMVDHREFRFRVQHPAMYNVFDLGAETPLLANQSPYLYVDARRSERGHFERWHIKAGIQKYQDVPTNQFAVFAQPEGGSPVSMAFALGRPAGGALSGWSWNLAAGAYDVCALGRSDGPVAGDRWNSMADAAAWAILGECWLCKPRVTGGLP